MKSGGRGKLPQGSLLLIPALIPSLYGPLILLYRSRLPGLVRGSEAKAIRGFDSGFGVDFVVGPLARSAAVWCKSFVFSSLLIRKVLVLPFAEGVSPPLPVVSLLFSVSYPQP